MKTLWEDKQRSLYFSVDLLFLIPLENLQFTSAGYTIFVISRYLPHLVHHPTLIKPMNEKRQITILKLKLRTEVIIPTNRLRTRLSLELRVS